MRGAHAGAGQSEQLDEPDRHPGGSSEKNSNLMNKELTGGAKTGFAPYLKETQIMFDHRWLLLIGEKK